MARFVPSTPAAAFHMLDRSMQASGRMGAGDPPEAATSAASGTPTTTAYDGLDLVIVGRSTNVGKPAAILGLARNATVVSAPKHTHDAGRLGDYTRRADILIVAAASPAHHRRHGRRRGDRRRHRHQSGDRARRQHPLGRRRRLRQRRGPRRGRLSRPGGVGPITDVWVLHNALLAARALAGSR